MRRIAATSILAIALTGIALPSFAQGVQFRQLVRTGVVTPGVNVNFDDVREPVLDGNWLAFCAQSFTSFGKNGIYRTHIGAGSVGAIATDSTASPSGGGNFRDMCITGGILPSIDDVGVAFSAYSNTLRGVYLWYGSVSRIVDEDSVFPDTVANPSSFDSPSIDGRTAVTWSNTPQTPSFAGVYSFDSNGTFTVTDTNPGTPTFFNVSQASVGNIGVASGDGQYVWLVNQTPSGPSFVYRRSYAPPGPIELVASEGQEIANGHFVAEPVFPQVDRTDPDQLCFMGGAPLQAVYRFDGTEVELVAGTATAIPGGTGNFTTFGLWCSIDAGEVALVGYGSGGQSGIYIGRTNGTLEKLIASGDSLGAGTAEAFSLSREAISQGRVAFSARVGSEAGIWVAPEPGSAATGMVVLALLASAQRLRGAGRASASSRAINASTL